MNYIIRLHHVLLVVELRGEATILIYRLLFNSSFCTGCGPVFRSRDIFKNYVKIRLILAISNLLQFVH